MLENMRHDISPSRIFRIDEKLIEWETSNQKISDKEPIQLSCLNYVYRDQSI